MALSGRINGTVSRNSAYFSFYIDWDVTNSEADRIAYNRSVVRVKVYLATNNTARQFDTVSSRSHWVKIDGSTDSWNARIDCNPWPSNPYLLRTYSKTVYHNSDGTKSLNISAYVDATASTWGAGDCNASATITLDTIPRSSIISSFPDFTIGDTFTVAITRYSPSFTHDLTLKRGSEIIATRTGIGTSYDFTLTTTEQDRIYASIPNSTSVTLTLYCTTKNGSTTIGSTVSKTATAYVSSSIVPTFTSLTATETNSAVSAVTSSFVQNLSRIKFTINGAAGAKYSTISSYKIVFNGVTYNSSTATTGAINKSGNLTATATITDSRGRTASKSITIAMLAYSPPQITSLTVKRCNSDGTLNEMGDYASVYSAGTWSGIGNNTCTIRIMSRVRGTSTWTTKHTSEDTSPPSFGATQIVGIYNVTSSYDFRIEAQDKFNTTISLAILPTGIVPMSWGKEGIGVGKVYEQGALDVGGDIYCDGSYIGGFGSVRVPSGADLNDYTSVGFYYNPSNAEVGTMANTPTAQAFSLLVEKHAGTKQTFTVYNTSNVSTYVRNYYNGTWSAWRQVWNNTGQAVDADKVDGKHASDFASASHSHSYLPLSGGTLTGDLYFSGANRYIGTSTNHNFYIRTNNVTRLSCYADGTFRFVVPSDGEYTIYVDISGKYSGATRPTIRPSADTYGYVGTSTYRFYQMYASGGFQSSSERSMKENIIPEATISDYNLVKKMKFYRYNLKPEYEGGKPALRKTRKPIVAYTEGKAVVTGHVEEKAVKRNEYLGVMVDDLPDFMTDEERTSVNLYTFSSVIGAGLQETIRKLEELEAKVAEKEIKLQELEDKISQLESVQFTFRRQDSGKPTNTSN